MRARAGETVLLVCGLAAVCSVGCIIPAFEPDCPEEASCQACLDTSGCGFCVYSAEAGLCIPGTSFGPDEVGACQLSRWRFSDCGEPPAAVECPGHATCTSCADDDACGWCYEASECRARDDDGGCALETSSWTTECREADLALVTTCEECLAADGYWSAYGTGGCVYDAYDLNDTWRVDSTCPPPNRCSDHDSCSVCLADGCGWCYEEGYETNTYACIPVDEHGSPYTIGCSSWADTFSTEECPY